MLCLPLKLILVRLFGVNAKRGRKVHSYDLWQP